MILPGTRTYALKAPCCSWHDGGGNGRCELAYLNFGCSPPVRRGCVVSRALAQWVGWSCARTPHKGGASPVTSANCTGACQESADPRDRAPQEHKRPVCRANAENS